MEPPKHVIVDTMFSCATRSQLCVILALHIKLRREIRKDVDGLRFSTTTVLWRRLEVHNISLWDRLESVYSMGASGAHVRYTQIPSRLGVATACHVFSDVGPWQDVMFPHSSVPVEPAGEQDDLPRHA